MPVSAADRRGERIRPSRALLGGLAMLSIAAALGVGGCAHRQLGVSTVLTANSFQEIVYQIILNNIAMFAAEPETLPWHVRVKDGTVQIRDELGIGQNGGGFTTFGGRRLGIEILGPQGSRQVALQWGTDAVGDPVQMFALQTAYRRVLGLPPMPPPGYILEAAQARRASGGGSGSDGGGVGDGSTEIRPGPSSMEISHFGEVPTGWFGVGSKKEVPKDARYVGRHGDVYVWVMPEGVGGLARFTLLVLSIVKLDASELASGRAGGDLMYSP